MASFAGRAVQPIVTQGTLTMVDYIYFHSIINYGINFGGNSSYSNSIFKLQKRIIKN
jgi:hypothetical protein